MGSGSSKEDSNLPPSGKRDGQATKPHLNTNPTKTTPPGKVTSPTKTKPDTNKSVAISDGRKPGVTTPARGKSGTDNRSESRQTSKSSTKNQRKSVVRQIEKGLTDENSEDVKNLFGLERLKTHIRLKREKTMNAGPDRALKQKGHGQALARFKDASHKVQENRTYEKPKTIAEEIIRGHIDVECPSTTRVVRIFTSSTFTDTMHERNCLMEEAYPKLKALCQELGYEFQVVDMRWGVRDQATDDHMGTELCLKELKQCQKLSTGPNFVSLMSHKYGYSDFPRVIENTEFQAMMDVIGDKTTSNLFKKWYTKDENAIPPAYVVSSISSLLPDFLSTDQDKKAAAKKVWWSESEAMQAALEKAAIQVFSQQKSRKYIRSVTECEVAEGLLVPEDAGKHGLWLRRTIDGLENHDADYLLSRYTECSYNCSEEKLKKTRELLTDVKQKIEKKLPASQILDYTVPLDPKKGIDPQGVHKNYLHTVCQDFTNTMSSMIKKAVTEKREITEDPVLTEIIQHTVFCQNKCKEFYGREKTMDSMQKYVQGMSNDLMVIHGPSGSGKTSIMAMAAKNTWKWTNEKAVVIVRFIGTTPASSTLTSLLSSITQQVRKAYGISWTMSKDFSTIVDEFQLCMFLASTSRPLVLILDSLDQLDSSHNARQLQWLPSRLRPNVKIIVSTLPDDHFECLPILEGRRELGDKTMVRSSGNIIAVPKITDKEAIGIIHLWLDQNQRKLTENQRGILLNAFAKCPSPLFLKLSFDEAVTWTSFAPRKSTVLETTVRASINSLFEKLEQLHGKIFVSRALGYLTTARNGLTETEWEDVMSCDDDVLNDVYLYWEPPMRRLPPLLLVRLRTDLKQYLVDRGADGVRVIGWYHRQFVEAARERYCSDPVTSQQLHAALGDFFNGIWADGRKKPYTNRKGENGQADRLVTSQPLKYGSSHNYRKLNNLPYHRIKAKQLELLKQDCLMNLAFLLNKLIATDLWSVLGDFSMSRLVFPEDDGIAMIADVLQLSQHGLLYDPNQLIPQLIGRCKPLKSLDKFLETCRRYPVPYLLPDKQILAQPGGQLLHSMAGHKAEILSLDMTADGKTVVTCGDDGTIRLWSVREGRQIKIMEGLGKVSRALFCNADRHLLIEMNKKLTVRSVQSGEKLFDLASISDNFPMCLVGLDKDSMVAFSGSSATLYDLTTGEIANRFPSKDQFEFSFPAFAVGSKNYAAVTDSEQVYIGVLDLRKKVFCPMVRGFEPFLEVGLEESIQYEIDEMAITTDEKYVVYGNIYTNDIVFLDIKKLSKDRVIKGDPNNYIRSLKCSPDCKSLYLVTNTFVNFIDLKSGKKTEELEHAVDVISVITRDMKTIVTAAEDSAVRIWDRTRKVQKLSKAPGITANRIRSLKFLDSSRYIVGFGFKSRELDSQFLFVYDVIKGTSVRERLLDTSLLGFEMLSSTELLVLPDYSYRLQTIDLNKMAVTKTFQGRVSSKHFSFKVLQKRGEVIALSQGSRNIKIYDVKSGKVKTILQTGLSEKLEGFIVNQSETVLVAYTEETRQQLIFDIQETQLLHALQHDNAMYTEGEIDVTADGRFLLFTVEGVPPMNKTTSREKTDVIYIQVWDVSSGKKVVDLIDQEYYLKYLAEKERSGLSVAVDNFRILDNEHVMVASDDFVIRIFEIKTGTLAQRLHGHTSGVELNYNPRSHFFLSYGSWTEENSFRIWDKSTYECLASYTLDKLAVHVTFSSDGRCILATTGRPAEVITWRLFNFDQQPTATGADDYPQILQGENNIGFIDLVDDEEGEVTQADLDDPDKDINSSEDEGED